MKEPEEDDIISREQINSLLPERKRHLLKQSNSVINLSEARSQLTNIRSNTRINRYRLDGLDFREHEKITDRNTLHKPLTPIHSQEEFPMSSNNLSPSVFVFGQSSQKNISSKNTSRYTSPRNKHSYTTKEPQLMELSRKHSEVFEPVKCTANAYTPDSFRLSNSLENSPSSKITFCPTSSVRRYKSRSRNGSLREESNKRNSTEERSRKAQYENSRDIPTTVNSTASTSVFMFGQSKTSSSIPKNAHRSSTNSRTNTFASSSPRAPSISKVHSTVKQEYDLLELPQSLVSDPLPLKSRNSTFTTFLPMNFSHTENSFNTPRHQFGDQDDYQGVEYERYWTLTQKEPIQHSSWRLPYETGLQNLEIIQQDASMEIETGELRRLPIN